MRRRILLFSVVLLAAVGAGGAVVWLKRQRAASETSASAKAAAPIPELTAVTLTDDAIQGLGLNSQPVKLKPYPRTLEVPGTVIDKPGHCDHNVATPVAGMITHIYAVPGDIVRPGDPLFTIRLVSETGPNSQSELYKTFVEMKLNRELVERLQQSRGSVPDSRFFEAEQNLQRLEATVKALRNDLLMRGLTQEQVDGIQSEKFVKELTIPVPSPQADHPSLMPVSKGDSAPLPFTYEVQELKAVLGESVAAGEVMASLANHHLLLIEGRVFDSEAGLVAAAAKSGESIDVDFPGVELVSWPEAQQKYVIRSLGNVVDPASRTLPFYVPLENQSKTYTRDGKTFLIWRYRPGQRVRLRLPIETIPGAFVVPLGAVVKDGIDSFVYRRSGDTFQRRPVRVLYEDRLNAVLSKEGGISEGQYVVMNNAAAVERARKAAQAKLASGGVKPGGHWHADGSYHEGSDD